MGDHQIAGRQGSARPHRRDLRHRGPRPAFAPPAERVAHRSETAPLLDAFFAWAEATLAKLSAKSELAEAFRYILKRRVQLSRFVTDGRLEADNNIAENAMRAIAVGRKNYLFAGSDAGEERAAAIYTIVQTASSTASTQRPTSPTS